MARGWESKSIESQIEAVESRRAQSPKPSLSPEEVALQRQRESLELSRIRVMRDLAEAKHPRYRESLQLALRYLEDKLAGLNTEQKDK